MDGEQALAAFEEAEADELNEWLQTEGMERLPAGRIGNIDLDVYVDDLLAIGRAVLRDHARNRAVYERKRKELDNWLENVQAPLEKRMRWLDELLMPLARVMKYPGKAKSRSLPNGKIGMRARPARVDLRDVDAAVAFCERHDLAVKKEPYKKPILELLEHRPELLEVAEEFGIEYHPKDEQGAPFWKVPEHEETKA